MAYVYRHVRLDKNEPFYIGISSDSDYKRANSKLYRNNHWEGIVNNTEYRVDILFDEIDLEEAKKKEIEFISIYGRSDLGRGTLCNLTDGGEGAFGCIPTKEARRKMSETRKGRKMHSEETRLKISKSMTGKKKPPRSKEHLRKLSEKGKNRVFSDDSIAKMAESKGKVSIEDVIKIRQLRKDGLTLKEISEMFNTTMSSVSKISLRKTWKHI